MHYAHAVVEKNMGNAMVVVLPIGKKSEGNISSLPLQMELIHYLCKGRKIYLLPGF